MVAIETRALVLLLRIPVLEVAMGLRLFNELLWVLRLVVNVKSGSPTVQIIRAPHLVSDEGGALLSYPH